MQLPYFDNISFLYDMLPFIIVKFDSYLHYIT